MSGKALYSRHKELFDNFAALSAKNNFDIEPYIKYCVSCGINEKTLEVCLKSSTMITKYLRHVKTHNLRKRIYKWFIKSAKNIASRCLDEGYFTAKDFIKMLVKTHQIGKYVITGEISLYYFAAFPNFKKIIPKLDYFSRKELALLAEHFDIYHSEVNKAFLQEKNTYVNPVEFTDLLMSRMREKRKL